jgi:putative holliday junction resolvase
MSFLTTLNELAGSITPNTRLMGLDLGTKTIGLAVATVSVGMASRLTTIRRTKFKQDAQTLMDLVHREKIGVLVLGLPFNMDGSEGPRAQSTRAFVRNLAPFAPPPVLLWDERLSSVTADESMIAAGLSKAKRAERIDAVAAQIILQSALDQLLDLYEETHPTSDFHQD